MFNHIEKKIAGKLFGNYLNALAKERSAYVFAN
jgi:hypothetical protein